MRRILLLLGFALFSIGAIHAQRTITGTVTDESGEPLIGATVQVKGTTKGVITDFDGNYTLEVPSGSNTLVYSYIGYAPQEIEIGVENVIDVTLSEDTKVLEEVVVIGYAEKSREELTGTVGRVSGEELETAPIATFVEAMQGLTPGVVIQGGSGQPGSTPGVTIRGTGSIDGSSAPLYIIDGIEVTTGAFRNLNMSDIESISVLKDASTTSIYGSRGANGVILVTTKRGKSGQTEYNYTSQFGWNSWTKDDFPMMNSAEKLAFEEHVMSGPGWMFSPNNPVAPEGSAQILDSLRNINTNWRDEIFSTGQTMSHTLSARGGTDENRFYVSGQFYDEEGQMVSSDLQRGNLRFNFDHDAGNHVKFGLSTTIGYSKQEVIATENLVNLNNPFAQAYLKNPYEQVWLDEEAGIYQFGAAQRNHLEEVFYNDRYNTSLAGVGGAYFEVNFLKNFTAKTNWGLDYRNAQGYTYLSPDSKLGLTVNPGNRGSLSESQSDLVRYTGSTTLRWEKQISEDHRLDLLGGQEIIKQINTSQSFAAYGPDPEIKTPAGLPEDNPNLIPVIGGGKSRKVNLSWFGRVDYSFKNRYFLSAGLRRDASSIFGENKKWGTFWNAGASWVASREDFIRSSNTISYLKFSVNYGIIGSDAGLGYYERLPSFVVTTYNAQEGIIPQTPGNPDLQWEETHSVNIGVELGLWDDRFNTEINLYNEDIVELFLPLQLSRTTGFSAQSINAGTLRNRGIEVLMDADIVRTRDFAFNAGFNFAYNDNEIIDLVQAPEFESGTGIIREGLPISSHYVVEWAGVDPATGDPLYYDLDGNVTNVYSDDFRKAVYGSSDPNWTGGVHLQLGWKGLELFANANWEAEKTLFNNESFFQENHAFVQFNQYTIMNTIWKEPGDITEIQRIGTQRQFTSKDLEDGSYLRLRTVRLSYTLSKETLGTLLNNARIYVQGTNLFTWTDFTSFDPEIANNIAQYEYPEQKTYSFGVEIGF